ncbi:MAG TPA: porin family protein [Cyclobacteriaceae bacterium]
MKTTKIFLLGAMFAMAIGLANAQDVPPPKFGIKGGINLSNLYAGDEVGDQNLKVGLNLGLMAKMPINNGFAIQPEVIYSSQGSRINYNNSILGKGEYRFNLNYVQVPVLAVINLGEYFNIHVGPYVSFLTSANIKNMDSDGDIDDIADLDVDDFNRVDYGFAGGVAFETKGFTAGARYNLGLKEIGKSGTASGEAVDNMKNSFGTVFVGFTF